MKTVLYKTRRNRLLAGVLAGLADKFKFDLSLIRFLYILFTISSSGFGVVIYISLAVLLPTKEDIEAEMYGTGPRKRKDAEPIDDDKGLFW